eukprot:TRINITY_DN9811_c0_g1_i2.p1 TRINITY_DN9811_c0_g1~~TRINITY_DN9811_c0_g1_i2.p1  ORF type:complete len:116 (-),score=12.56 TRINITY_DN9811_c0_g1_i2:68-370(-)
MAHFYELSTEDWLVTDNRTLLDKQGNSPSKVVEWSYPKEGWKWVPWMFRHVENGFWRSKDNCTTYLDWLGLQLDVCTLPQWDQVGVEEVRARRACPGHPL